MNKVLKVKGDKALSFYVRFICMTYNISGDSPYKFMMTLYRLQSSKGTFNDEEFIKKETLIENFPCTQMTFDKVRKELDSKGIIDYKRGYLKLSRKFFEDINIGSSVKIEFV